MCHHRPLFHYSTFNLFFSLLFLPTLTLSVVSTDTTAPITLPTYKPGDPLPVSCLARTVETGEHILQDTISGALKYIPFPTCLETGKPLSLTFLQETDNKTCTIPSVDDEFFHLLEFYVHADSPLTCRVPKRPTAGDGTVGGEPRALPKSQGQEDEENYVHFVISLSGKIELSHIHLSPFINMIFHLDGDDFSSSTINSATAYSIASHSPSSSSTKITIGSPLKLTFSIRWFPSPHLPKLSQIRWSDKASSHVTVHTFLYCLITAIGTTALCAVYFRGWEMPRKLRRFNFDRLAGGTGAAMHNGSLGSYSASYGGYGYGYNGRGATPGAGKKD